MTFLARECPNLQSLKLWGPGDTQEGPLWVNTCQKEKEWVQAILQIRGLSYFDIPVIKGGVIYDYQAFRDDFLPWLKTSLLQNTPRHHDPPSFPQARPVPSFPFLQLPSNVRRRVYELLLLPPNRRLHPYLKPWYDQTTHNLVPLLRTCRFIQNEAEKVLYEGAIFTSLTREHDHAFLNFVWKSLPDRLRDLFRSVRFEDGDDPYSSLIAYLAIVMQVETLTLVLSAAKVDRLNAEWEQGAGERPCPGLDETFLRLCARFSKFTVETSDPASILNPACRAWLETRSGAKVKNPTPVEYAWLPYDPDNDDPPPSLLFD